MTTNGNSATTVNDVQQKYKAIIGDRTKSKTDKVPLVQAVKAELAEIDKRAASDFSFPLHEVQASGALCQKIDEWLRGAGVEV